MSFLKPSARPFFSIRWKLLLVCLVCVTLPAIVLGTVNYNTYRREVMTNTARDLKLVALGWKTATEIYRSQVDRIMRREQYLVEKRLTSVALDIKKMVELYFEMGGKREGPDFERLLNKIASIEIGRNGYAFIVDGESKYVVSKNRKHDGVSIYDLNSKVPASNYRVMVEDARRSFPDEVKIYQYPWQDIDAPEPRMKISAVTYYAKENLLIAASMFYTDYKSYELEATIKEELKDRMAHQKIGERGYIWVFSAEGDMLVSKDRFRDGERVIDTQDKYGRYVVKDIIGQALKWPEGDPFITEYFWQEFGETKQYEKIAAVVYDRGWGWVIGVGAYEEDFLKGLEAIRRHIVQICLLFIMAGSFLAYFLALFISRPLRKLEAVAAVSDMSIPIDPQVLSANDEIGRLGGAFALMRKNLYEKIQELEHSRLDLVKKNEELQKAQGQLVQSEKLAAIGQLAAGVAHEINNPLAYVMSNMETLELYINRYEQIVLEYEKLPVRKDAWENLDDARMDVTAAFKKSQENQFERIRWDLKAMVPDLRDGLNRVRRIVMDLRTFARVEQEPKSAVDIEEVLEQVLTIVWNEIKYKAQVVREYGRVPKALCQSQRIGQVFINMLVNAAQAISQGQGEEPGVITLRTYVKEGYVCVDIQDTGKGIQRENMAKIFEPFFTTKPVGQGTGLGLSISYEIVSKLGGDICVSSEPGKGTTFTVVLPRADQT